MDVFPFIWLQFFLCLVALIGTPSSPLADIHHDLVQYFAVKVGLMVIERIGQVSHVLLRVCFAANLLVVISYPSTDRHALHVHISSG
jgi:hypothetical protein